MASSYKVLHSLSKVVPAGLRALVRRWIAVPGYHQWLAEQNDPFAQAEVFFQHPQSPCVLGIIREIFHYHQSYVAACRELGISYKLLDVSGSDWIRVVQESGCDAFLVWPTVKTTVWKAMFDDRMRTLVEDLGRIIYPSLKELWLYENKRRVRDWLLAHSVPHPCTWVFYDRREAVEFAKNAELPLVFKTAQGATTSGVRILRTRRQAETLARQAFARGFVPQGFYPQDRQWGTACFQEYLPDVREWRMVRIGDSYFGYRKERVGDFHSGSHAWSWLDPPRPLLDLLRDVTEKGGFTSMDVDIFETQDGRLLVNELQTVFGATTPADQLRVNGKPGRYCYHKASDAWVFEEGDFCRNACANLRVEYLVRRVLNRD